MRPAGSDIGRDMRENKTKACRRIWLGLSVLLCVLRNFSGAQEKAPEPPEDKPFPLFYSSDAPFREAIAGTTIKPPGVPVTGLTLPHHALALDLIAEGLALAVGGDYERIIIISPDHFRRGKTAGSTADRDFLTVMGRIRTDKAAAKKLAGHPLLSLSSLASHEHGFRAILPLVAGWFPDIPVLTIAVGIRTTPEEWKGLAEAIEPFFTEKTLLIQSTDFSHYLTASVAREKDAETLRILALEDPDLVNDLHQPDHIDSKAAQWIQMTLQKKRGSRLTVVNNRNAAAYVPAHEPEPRETTSYVTQAYSPDIIPSKVLPGKTWYLGGDFHLGRTLAEKIHEPRALDFLEKRMQYLTGGAPLILNLEGVLSESPRDPATLHPMQIVMPAKETLELFHRWNVAAVVLANNHTLDLGVEGYAATKQLLGASGITVIEDKARVHFPEFDLYAATDVHNRPEPEIDRLRSTDLPLREDKTFPQIAFFHWGQEYRPETTARQHWLTRAARESGFDLITGCHPHVPSTGWTGADSALVYPSLGNLLFDQIEEQRGGTLLELRFFEQGTFATRLIPVGNLYREWMKSQVGGK